LTRIRKVKGEKKFLKVHTKANKIKKDTRMQPLEKRAKARTQELECKLRGCDGARQELSICLQSVARRVERENERLRRLVAEAEHGFTMRVGDGETIEKRDDEGCVEHQNQNFYEATLEPSEGMAPSAFKTDAVAVEALPLLMLEHPTLQPPQQAKSSTLRASSPPTPTLFHNREDERHDDPAPPRRTTTVVTGTGTRTNCQTALHIVHSVQPSHEMDDIRQAIGCAVTSCRPEEQELCFVENSVLFGVLDSAI